ncbi:MAG: tetratricopeptide repeat protein [Gammaproteobacteria bacterium]|nr:tetratricopeptide repeat protein [Gammaproteobacteria bacterium]
MSDIEGFEALLDKGQDNALLRYTLGALHLQKGAPQLALPHLRAALDHDPDYSAAWRALGKALTETGEIQEAINAYSRGIEVAEARGDKQAAKEMRVFLKRLHKS